MNFEENLSKLIKTSRSNDSPFGSELNGQKYSISDNPDSTDIHREINKLVSEFSYIILFDGTSIKQVQWLSDTFSNFTGYNLKELLTDTFVYTSVINESDRYKYLNSLRNSIDFNDTYTRIDYRIKNKYGDFIWIKDNIKILNYDQNTGNYTVLGSVQDIHTEKLVEIAFRQSELKYRQLFENSLVPIIYYSTSGKILLINNQAAKALSSTTTSLIDRNVEEVYSAKKAEEIIQIIAKVVNTGKGVQREEMSFSEGRKKWFSVIYQPVKDLNGKIISVQKILADITEQKHKEEKIKIYNHELKKLNAGKDKLFSIIAHDLKSPFISLLGFSEYLINDLESLTQEEILEFASNINSSAKSIFNLLENLLQWSRLQTGKIQLIRKSFDLNKLLEEILFLFSHLAKDKEIKLINDLHEPEVLVKADSYMVDCIVRNIISNAIKFSNVRSSVYISSVKRAGMIEISIKDSGIGMPEDIRDSLFNDNNYISTPGTGNERGTGLGMVITREFVELNGGKISVASEEGKGTIFTFTLPAAN